MRSTTSRSLELISGMWNYRIGLDYYNLSREVHFWTLVHTNNGHDGHAKNMIRVSSMKCFFACKVYCDFLFMNTLHDRSFILKIILLDLVIYLISGMWNYRIGLDYYNLSREVHFWTLVHTNNGHDGQQC
jgi:hypothetical protein